MLWQKFEQKGSCCFLKQRSFKGLLQVHYSRRNQKSLPKSIEMKVDEWLPGAEGRGGSGE